jgi:hypothetical protein
MRRGGCNRNRRCVRGAGDFAGADRNEDVCGARQYRGIAKDFGIGGRRDRIFIAQVIGDITGLKRHPKAQDFLKWKVELSLHSDRARKKNKEGVVENSAGRLFQGPIEFPHLEPGGCPQP